MSALPQRCAFSIARTRYELDTVNLVVLPLPVNGLQREIGITTRTGVQLPPGAKVVLDEVRRVSAGFPAR
jgi:LysR family transcriptional regulator of gallate degradation